MDEERQKALGFSSDIVVHITEAYLWGQLKLVSSIRPVKLGEGKHGSQGPSSSLLLLVLSGANRLHLEAQKRSLINRR